MTRSRGHRLYRGWKGQRNSEAEREKKQDPNRRSASARCARCKKVRKMWMRANEWDANYRVSFKNVPGEGKVCWICVIREVNPDFKPGDPIPEECLALNNVQPS